MGCDRQKEIRGSQMTMRYTNSKAETYYLHKRTGKKGGSQYSFSRKEAGTLTKEKIVEVWFVF